MAAAGGAKSAAKVQQIVEVTSCDRDQAAALLVSANNDVDLAISLFYDLQHREGGASFVPKTAYGDAELMDQARAVNFPVAYKPIPVGELKGDEGIPVKVYLAWDDEPLEFLLDSDSTVRHLKMMVTHLKQVPAIVQRVVFNANNLTDDQRLLRSGFKKTGVNDVAILYAKRNDDGEVSFVKYADQARPVFVMPPGEWSMSSSIAAVRKTIAGVLKLDESKVMLVFNGLSLKDSQSFGMCGLHGGARVFVFRVKGGKGADAKTVEE